MLTIVNHTPVSPDPRLEALLENGDGLLDRATLDAHRVHPRILASWLATGRLRRIRRGLYQAPDHFTTHQDLLEAWMAAPYSVVCLISALVFHNLGTQVPGRVYLAVNRTHRAPELDYPPLEVHHFPPTIFGYGVQHHLIGQRQVPIYSPEKTLADLLRYERFTGRDVFLEGLQHYLRGQERDLKLLMDAAKVCKVEGRMGIYVEALVNDSWGS